MKILRLLNKKFYLFLLISFLGLNVHAEDQPVDIWNIDKNENNISNDQPIENKPSDSTEINESNIYKMQSQKKLDPIELDVSLDNEKINIYGLYDPEDYDLDISMWSNSN